MKKIFEENPEYKIVEAHNGALGVYALHAAKVNHIPVRIFHAHGASITRDWKLPIKLVCKALLPSNMNQHFSCGIEAARCYFGEKVVERNDYELISNAIEVNRFVFDSTIRNRIRHDNHLENKHIVGHVGRFMSQKNHTFLLDVFAEVSKRDGLTLGDFWGFHEEYPSYDEKQGLSNGKGVSCILVNTNQGKVALEQCESQFVLMTSDFDKVARHNDQLHSPSKYSPKREQILELYQKEGYEAVDRYFHKNYKKIEPTE